MGMDVYGKKPNAVVGRYFRNNVGSWHPLAEYLTKEFPTLAKSCTTWHTNEGGGLDGNQSCVLAAALESAIATGATQAYAERLGDHISIRKHMEGVDLNWTFYGGQGLGTDGDRLIKALSGMAAVMGIDGDFSVENVRDFAEFLKHSGGFEIW